MSSDYRKTHIGQRKLKPSTQMMSYGYDPFMSEGSVKPPIFLTSTFAFKSAEDGAEFFDIATGRKEAPEGERGGLIYSRINHPNMEIVQDRLALIEGAEACALCASGMGAISSTFLAFLRPGDVVIHTSPLYGGTEVLIRNMLAEFGILSVELHDALCPDAIARAVEAAKAKGPVKMIYTETPGNPTNALVDFSLITAAAARLEEETGERPITVCDNTLQGPLFQHPVEHGIDLTVYSLTKYVGGHSDLVAGSVAGRKDLVQRIGATRTYFGLNLDPHTCWMISRSLETLVIRMERAADSGTKIAKWLASNPYHPVKVLHPELIEDEAYRAVYDRQCTGPGSTFSFVIEGGGRADAFRVINALTLFKSAVSLGGSESLACHPASTTHSGVPEEVREQVGLHEGLIRLSIGLENADDLLADLEQAFATAFATAQAAE
ncbi:MAG: cystathionine gamma-synthase family protein [Alphaproteobacteria bacterium]